MWGRETGHSGTDVGLRDGALGYRCGGREMESPWETELE